MKILLSFIFLISIQEIGFCQQPKLVIPIGHTGEIHSLEISPDNKYILTASQDRRAKIWEIISSKQVLDLKGHLDDIRIAHFSPDGRKIVTASDDHSIKIWDLPSGKEKISINVGIEINQLNFSADGGKIVIASKGIIIIIVDANTGKLLVNLTGHTAEVYSAAFSPDGKEVVTTSEDRTMRIWDAESGKQKSIFSVHTDRINSVNFSPERKTIITASRDKSARIWINAEGVINPSLTVFHTDDVNYANFSKDGKKVITASDDGTAKVWDAQTGDTIMEINHLHKTLYANFTKDENSIITCSMDTVFCMKKWDANSGELLATMEIPSAYTAKYKLLPDKKRLLLTYGENNESAKLYDIESGKTLADLKGKFSEKDNNSWQIIIENKIISLSENSIIKTFDYEAGKSTNIFDGGIVVFNSYGKRTVHIEPDDSSARVVQVDNRKTIAQLKEYSHTDIIQGSSSDDNMILSYSEDDYSIQIWNSSSGKLICELIGHKGLIYDAEITPDNKKVISASADETIQIWSIESHKSLFSFKLNDLEDTYFKFKISNDGNKLFINNEVPEIRDINSGKLVSRLIGHSYSGIHEADFSPDMKRIVTAGWHEAKVWNISTGEELASLDGHEKDVDEAVFTPDGKKIITSSEDQTIKIWNSYTGVLIASLEEHSAKFNCEFCTYNEIDIRPGGKHLLTTGRDWTAKVWEINSGKLLFNLDKHENIVNFAGYSPDGKKIITSSNDNSIKVWNADTGELIYTYLATINNNFLLQIPTGYYHASPGIAKTLYYTTKDLKVIGFDQLDVKFNRPDKVLEAIGSKDTSLIQAYHNAYLKRIDRLKINTTKFKDDYSFPECDFPKRDSIKFERTEKILYLDIKTKSDKYLLDRFNVWVNEVPLYGINGISLKSRNKKDFDTTLTIYLSNGNNQIEASVFDENATESYRSPLLVNYTNPDSSKTKTWFVGIGVNQYKNHPCRNLNFAVKDITDLDILFKKNVAAENYLFLDSNATRQKIMAIKNALMQSDINDKVIIALSGHGILHQQRDFYFGTYDMDFSNPDLKGLKYEELASLLDDIPARKKLLLIDACHSGETDTSQAGKELTNVNANPCITDNTKTDDPEKLSNPGVGLESSFELMKDLFIDLTMGNGAVVISAAKGLGFAEENKTWQNGAFTLCIKAAFSGNTQFAELKETADKNADGVSVNELKDYILETVPKITNNRQKPTIRKENIETDWKIK